MDISSALQTTSIPAALTSGASLSSPSEADTQKTQFLKLLVAQLRGQNPLDPLDGTQFVTQLAQFSSVEELINIRTILERLSKASTDGATASPFQGA